MEVSARDASYALGIVKAICEEIGPGLPGSDQLLNVLKLACEWIREGGGKGAT